MSVNEARTVFGRTLERARSGQAGPEEISRALASLDAIRRQLDGGERRQVELYLGVLEDEWADQVAAAHSEDAPPVLAEAQRLARAALESGGDTAVRLDTAHRALSSLAALSRGLADRAERLAVGRLCEPLVLLVGKLEREVESRREGAR
ncbi:MAG TPA: hypothetical protein VIA06_03470 [Candidatus Dormibacteraeota bacterium]|jgi:hypothetical protein|nr:hypothetical protein [Candidatus Dormibacteraeota bacterium]